MPTISLTAKDLRQILENSRNYDAFARSRPISAKIPAYDRRYRQRSRSRSKSRSRARSVSQSRAPNRVCPCCNSKQCEVRNPGLPRPQSAQTRPRSAKASYGERPRSAQMRPQSAKASLPPRPSSAQPRSRNIEDYDTMRMDYSGLSNMMRKLNFQPTRKWKSKSPSRENTKKKTEIQKDEKIYKAPPAVDTNLLRKSRSSTYTKFKYPEKYHTTLVNRHLNIEENIPQCLRKFPRYINQPKRHNCSYNPQGSAVSYLLSHNIKSGNLPPQKIFKPKQPQERTDERGPFAISAFETPRQDLNVVGLDSYREDGDDSEHERNGTFSYVFQPKQSDAILDMEDIEDDDVNGNTGALETPRNLSLRNKRVDDAVISITAPKESRVENFNSEDESEDDIADQSADLKRTDSQEEFEKLLQNITGNNDKKKHSASPERPLTPLSDFHDDDSDKNDILNRPISPLYSDEESIPEDIG